MKLFAARTAIDLHPKLILSTREQLNNERHTPTNTNNESPGVLSLHAAQILETNSADTVADSIPVPVSDARMRQLVVQCRNDPELVQNLLYDPRYDNKWKNCYTDVFLVEEGKKIIKPNNRQGWVVPLKNICDKVGISSKFFTDNRNITLQEARIHVLKSRLVMNAEPSAWLMEYDPLTTKNFDLMSYIATEFDPRALQSRLALYNEQTYSDRDRVRVSGKYYNNIQLGKRMFGPKKKQKFICSITGGMERRFEILDNQVNHLPFTHEAFDQNLDKCRNHRVKCRDSSRVILRYPSGTINTFIHANYVHGGPLFNKFIVTQAPMENTIGDFWRMVWQEKASYIFMLISRKDVERCAPYWPRRPEFAPVSVHGLHIYNVGISSSRDPVFRVTYIRIVNDFGDEVGIY
uniref:Tyrosine-protein phosphatase domain-containing protein n=1 Tax=Angiostrongylus cantonensis TaxID=6313 RepID=A0A0K0D4U5_ANGCA